MRIQLAAFLLFLSLVQAAGAAYTSYSGAWEETDAQSSAYTLSLLSDLNPGWSLGVYDIGEDGSPSHLDLIDSSSTFSTFYIDTSRQLHVTEGLSRGLGFSLTSPNSWFGFYFSDGSATYYTYDYDSAGPVNQWLLKTNFSGGPVILSDVAPVPIPGAVWLLGSGLIGLARTRKMNCEELCDM